MRTLVQIGYEWFAFPENEDSLAMVRALQSAEPVTQDHRASTWVRKPSEGRLAEFDIKLVHDSKVVDFFTCKQCKDAPVDGSEDVCKLCEVERTDPMDERNPSLPDSVPF